MGIMRKLFGPPNVDKLKAEGDVKGLIKALGNKNWSVRRQVGFALADFGDCRALPYITAVLVYDPDPWLRRQAVLALGKIGGEAALELLLAHLADESGEIRQHVAWTLGEFKDERALKSLISALFSKDRMLRHAAAFGLSKLKDRRSTRFLTGEITASDLGVSHTDYNAMTKEDRPNIGLKDPDSSVRVQAVRALGLIRDTQVINNIIQMLHDPDPTVRGSAAWTLSMLGDLAALEPLIAAQADSNSEVRSNISMALERLDPSWSERKNLEGWAPSESSMITVLLPALHNWSNPGEGVSAARALGRIGSQDAKEALVNALEGNADGAIPAYVFKAIVEELVRLDEDLLTEKLCQMFRQLPEMHAKMPAIIQALGDIGGQKALAVLEEALSDADSSVMQNARRALEELDN